MEDTARLLNRAEGSQMMMPTRRTAFNQGLEAFIILHIMNGNIYMYGALVQFDYRQHRYEWKGLWCSSTVRLLSTQT